MIIIFSIDGDSSTNKVIDWLIFFNTPHIRVNLENEDPKNLSLIIKDSIIDLRFKLNNGKEIVFSEVDYFFYRGGMFPKVDDYSFVEASSSNLPKDILANQLSDDLEILIDYFFKLIKTKSLGSPKLMPINKLEVLYNAKTIGFSIPDTIVCNSKNFIKLQAECTKKLIGKALSETISITSEGLYYDLNTSDIVVSDLSESFFPSLFQSKIDRQLELRVFVFGNKHYSIAMESERTDIREDFNGNTYKRYEISDEVFAKCKQLLKMCQLNTGSFDFILDHDDILHFLEVNPIGQFDFVSRIGNYEIEYDLAEYLTKKANKKP